jgi:hypothetical protein
VSVGGAFAKTHVVWGHDRGAFTPTATAGLLFVWHFNVPEGCDEFWHTFWKDKYTTTLHEPGDTAEVCYSRINASQQISAREITAKSPR